MAGQYQKLVSKQYNSPIHLYSDKNVREILERETKVLANGAVGIDFNNPMINKPANLQNSAVLRMLEEEENRKRSGQPGSLKRVAWPPPKDSELEEYIEQEPVQSQGGPLYSSKCASGSQNNQAPIQQLSNSPVIQQPQQPNSPNINNTFEPIFSPSLPSSAQSVAQSPYQSAPLPPNTNKSPVSFINLAKPWFPHSTSTPQFKTVQSPSLTTVQSYQLPKQYEYQSQDHIRETHTVVLPLYQPAVQETTFQQYPTPSAVESQHTYNINQNQEQQLISQSKHSDLTQISQVESHVRELQTQPVTKSFAFQSSTSIQVQPDAPKSEPSKLIEEGHESILQPTLPKTVFIEQPISPIQLQPTAQGIAQNQVPTPQKYQVPPKQVEPPPSTITLRPQAPVSQAPPPLVTSQPATATLRGGKHLRGDLKWPPENVKEKMAAEQQHLLELAKGPACKPKKQHKDYTTFFAKHALNSTYPGYKIPPGTQFYDHNPVM